MSPDDAKLRLHDLTIRYQDRVAVRGLNLAVAPNSICALVGPAGSGKTSVLRTINLLSVDIDGARVDGQICIDGRNILGPDTDRTALRRRVGMVFASPQPLPGSIRDNITYGPRLAGVRGKGALEALVEDSLRAGDLWDEVKDRLDRSALALSGGQQQRLCIARTLALRPEIILMDEPCSGLDPLSTLRIEQMMRTLRDRFTWLLVTNNTKQAARVSDTTAFLMLGDLIEQGSTHQLFTAPRDSRTGDYLEGRFG